MPDDWPYNNTNVVLATEGDLRRGFEAIGSENVLVNFYVSWCNFCKAFHPKYQSLADHVHKYFDLSGDLTMAAIESSELDPIDTLNTFNIHTYPTLILFTRNETHRMAEPYKELMESQDMFKFLRTRVDFKEKDAS